VTPVVDEHVVAHLRGLPDDDSRAVVYDEAAAYLRAGVYLDVRQQPRPLGDEPRDEEQAVPVEPMRNTVVYGGADAGVEQEYLELAAGGGVALLVCAEELAESCHKISLPFTKRKKPPAP
jgi:hypothetical protein